MFCTKARKSAAEGKAIHLVDPPLLDQDSPTGKRQRARGRGTQVSRLDYPVTQPFLLSDSYLVTVLDSGAMTDIEQYQRRSLGSYVQVEI